MRTIRCAPPVFSLAWGLVVWISAVASTVPGVAYGQEYGSERIDSGKRSGIWYGGQYFGFDPARVRRGDFESPTVAEALLPENGELIAGDETGTSLDEATACCDDNTWCGGGNLWARGEFLWWWMKGMNLPALATTSPNVGILPEATVLFGQSAVNDGPLPGGRFTLGVWLDDCDCQGVEASFLMLGRSSAGFHGTSENFSVLARPFTNVDPADLGAEASLIANPGSVTGALTIQATTQFYSFDLLWRRNLSRTDCCTTDLLIGYRHSELIDRVRIDETTTAFDNQVAGDQVVSFDQFRTRNEFNGAEFGLACQRRLNDCWVFDVTAKGAVGQVHSAIGIAGRTRTNPAAGASTFGDGGLLAQSTNIGSFSQSEFTAMGDFNVNLRRQLRCGWSANVGYSLIVWGSVLRAGDQIDTNVNLSQVAPDVLTGDPRPFVPFASTNFWAHGLQLGVERSF